MTGKADKIDREAVVIHLHEVEGLSAAEISWRLDTNVVTPRRILAEHAAREERRRAWRERWQEQPPIGEAS